MSRPPVRPASRPASGAARTRAPGGPLARAAHVTTSGARTAATRVHRAVLGVDTAPHWVSGLLAGLQGALLSWLAVVVPALAAYVATSADPSNADVGWGRSTGVGTALWLMGHGAPLRVDGVALTIVPLGITGLALFASYASARRSAHPSVMAWVSGVVGHLAFVLVAALAVGRTATAPTGPDLVRLGLGALAIAAVGLGAGTVRVHRIRTLTRPWWSRIDPRLRIGAGAGSMVLAQLVCLAAVVVASWTLAHRAAAGDVIDGLGVDAFGGLLMAVAQLALAPNLVLWAVAWLVGPGFSVGTGTVFSPAEVTSGPLPALPMLSALPTGVEAVEIMRWVPVTVVLVGALAGAWLERRVPAARVRDVVLTCVAGAAAAGALVAVACLLASGSAGPGRLADVGASALTVGAHTLVLSGAGMLLVALPSSALVRAATARGLRGSWARLRGRADVDLVGASDPARASGTGEPVDVEAPART